MSFKVHSRQTAKDLAKTRSEVLVAVTQVLGQLTSFAAAKARSTTGFEDRTGRLRGSIQKRQKSRWQYFVRAGGRKAPYARFIEFGTKEHEIKARRARFLRFEWNGAIVFRKRVWHPGTKPVHFMTSARDETEDLALRTTERALNSVFKR